MYVPLSQAAKETKTLVHWLWETWQGITLEAITYQDNAGFAVFVGRFFEEREEREEELKVSKMAVFPAG
jgi:hypothetical protein